MVTWRPAHVTSWQQCTALLAAWQCLHCCITVSMLMTIIGLLSSCQAWLVTRGDGDTIQHQPLQHCTIHTIHVIIPAAMGISNTQPKSEDWNERINFQLWKTQYTIHRLFRIFSVNQMTKDSRLQNLLIVLLLNYEMKITKHKIKFSDNENKIFT